MRLFLLLMLLSFPAFAQTQMYYEDTQAATLTPPTLPPFSYPPGATRPLLLTSFTTIRITVCPNSGASLLGTGSIRMYLYIQYIGGTAGKWTANDTMDLPLSITAVNICQTWGRRLDMNSGFLLPATQGVSDSSGNPVIVRVDGGFNQP